MSEGEETKKGRIKERLREQGGNLRKKWFRRDNLIVLVLSGILLFIIALPTSEKESGSEKALQGADRQTESVPTPDGGDYVREQEKRLADILSAMDGVGRVEVMLTLASSEELVVEKDSAVTRSGTEEADASGGRRTVTQTQTEHSTVLRTSGGAGEPYVIKTLTPRVEGVLVVAEGAETGNVSRHISQIVQALYGVEAYKVKVVPMG